MIPKHYSMSLLALRCLALPMSTVITSNMGMDAKDTLRVGIPWIFCQASLDRGVDQNLTLDSVRRTAMNPMFTPGRQTESSWSIKKT